MEIRRFSIFYVFLDFPPWLGFFIIILCRWTSIDYNRWLAYHAHNYRIFWYTSYTNFTMSIINTIWIEASANQVMSLLRMPVNRLRVFLRLKLLQITVSILLDSSSSHWIEKHGIVVHQDDWLTMVISQQYHNFLSVQLLPSNGSHFLAALRYALTNGLYTAF